MTNEEYKPTEATVDEPEYTPTRWEQIDRIQFEIDNVHQIHGDTCLCGFKSSRSRSRTEHLTALFAEAVLALEPEARAEPHHALEVDVLTWCCLKCGRPAKGHDKAREVTDAEVEAAARKIFEYDAPSHEPDEWSGLSEPLKSDYRGTALAALEAARKVK